MAEKQMAAAYCRCSTDKQEDSIGDQKKTIREYADKHRMQVITWYEDEGRSGTTFDKRPGFMRMVSEIEAGNQEFSTVLVTDVDRWGRAIDPEDSAYWRQHFRRSGVDVVFTSDDNLNQRSLGSNLNRTLKDYQATSESKKQSELVHERSKLRAAEGYRTGGFAPYGYKRQLVNPDGTSAGILEHGKRKFEKSQRVVLVLGPDDEMQVVKRIFKMKLNGRGYRAIANTLNREGILSPSSSRPHKGNQASKWSAGSVKHILENPVYCGSNVYNRQIRGCYSKLQEPNRSRRSPSEWTICEDAHPAIIASEQFSAVQSLRKKRSGKTRSRTRSTDYLLTGLIICEHCGYRFHGHKKTNNVGKKFRYYEDSGFRQRGASVCRPTRIPANKIESFVVTRIAERAIKMVDRERLRDAVRNSLNDSKGDQSANLGILKSDLAQVEVQIQNITDAIAKGGNLDSLIVKLESLNARKAATVEEISETEKHVVTEVDLEREVDEVLSLANDFGHVLKTANSQEIKSMIPNFVERIEVNPSGRRATVYALKLPAASQQVGEVSVNQCRRSDSNRHSIATGGF